jgi:voltage-gated potassium channel
MHISIFGVAPMIIVRLIDRLNENRDAFTHEEQEAIVARLDRIEALIAAQASPQPRPEAPRE